MARVSLELGSRGTARYESLVGDPGGRLHRRALRWRAEVLVVGGGGREHALVRALLRSPQRPRCSAPPATPGIARDKVRVPRRRRGRRRRHRRARRATARVDLVVVGPEAPLVAGARGRARRGRRARIRPDARRPRGSRARSAYAKELMRDRRGADRRRTRCCTTREEALEQLACASYPAVLKADALAAGKGVIICRGRARARAPPSTSSSPSGASATPRWCSRSSSRARSSRCSRCATASARSRWRRRRTTSGSSTATRARTPAGWAATRPCPASTREHAEALARAVHQPIVDELRRRGTPFHGVLYAGLMMTAGRPEGARVQLPLRRPRDAGGAAAPALRPARRCSRRAAAPGRPRGHGDRVVGATGRSRWCSPRAAIPSRPRAATRSRGLRSIDSLEVELLHAGTAETERPLRDRRRPGAERDRASVRRPARRASAPMRRPDRIQFDGKQMRRDIAARAVERVEV